MRTLNARFGVALVGLLVLPAVSQAQTASQEPDDWYAILEKRYQKLEKKIPAWMDSAGVPGLVIGATLGGEFVGARGWGVRDLSMQAPVDMNTVFEAASLTKPVFAYAVLKLVDRGELDLDQPLAEIVSFAEIADDPRAKYITPRMVLSHTTGLPNWRWLAPLEIQFQPGARFSYSGEGYVWLARAVEEITGLPLEDYLRREVFLPLGMDSSGLVWQDRFAENFAVGHSEDGMQREMHLATEPNAAASLYTTAPDYCRFLAAVLTGAGLSEEVHRSWLMPRVEVADRVGWALGWGVQEAEGRMQLWHWGDNDGSKSYVVADVESQFGFVVFTNSDNGMSMMRPVLAAAVGAEQPGLDWLGYEGFNSPRRIVRRILDRVVREEGVQATIEEYHVLKRHYPEEAFVENLLNNFGYTLMNADRIDDAIEIFKLNIREYPDSFNPYDSLGEAYMKRGDTLLAIENYERSVEINPDNDNGVRRLEELRKKLE